MRLFRIMKHVNTCKVVVSLLTVSIITLITINWNYKPNLVETEASIYSSGEIAAGHVTEKIREGKLKVGNNLFSKGLNITSIRQRNAERIERLNFYCNSQTKLQSLPISARLYTVFSLNFGITLVAKVASTTWGLFLSQIQCRECLKHVDPPRYVLLHNCVRAKLLNGKKLDYNAVLVRNPWTRLISVYQDKVVRSEYKRPAIQRCQDRWHVYNDDTLTFSQFVDCILELRHNPLRLDPHMMPQFLMHGPCTTGYTHIFKLESMTEDLTNLINFANPDFSAQKINDSVKILNSQERHSWQTGDKKSKIESYLNLYESLTTKQITNLQLLYRWDCHLYKYGINPRSEESYTLLL